LARKAVSHARLRPRLGLKQRPCNARSRYSLLAKRNCSEHRESMARILLAEDDTSMREYLQRALQRVGYEVSAVACGTEAMPLLETEQFDLLLTDIVMPEMDGIELAQKASAIDPSIRVMFITGFAAVALQGGRTAPEAKLLSKPFHLKDLVMEVDRIFQTEDQHGRL
jgi:two-component system, cell cycle response regulator CpdR